MPTPAPIATSVEQVSAEARAIAAAYGIDPFQLTWVSREQIVFGQSELDAFTFDVYFMGAAEAVWAFVRQLDQGIGLTGAPVLERTALGFGPEWVAELHFTVYAWREARAADIAALTSPWGHVVENIEAIRAVASAETSILRINVRHGEVGLASTSPSVEVAIAFVEALRASGRYTSVDYPRRSLAVSGTYKLVRPAR